MIITERFNVHDGHKPNLRNELLLLSGSSDVVPDFGVGVLGMFYLMFVHDILVLFGWMSGHLLGKSCSLG